MTFVLLALACGLAFANGANDNCKGVAALVSAGEATTARALGWAAATTALGSIVAFFWDGGLVALFRTGFLDGGADLPAAFFAAVMVGAIGWVLLATATGMPVSTTHAISGALVGAGLIAVGMERIGWVRLATHFALPLLLGPLVGFARAWNDTPKIAALALVAVPAGGSARLPFMLVTAAMALGGLVTGRRVLDTLSARVTKLPAGESLAASTASATLVSLASFHGLPLSTTHVATGAVVGAGLARDHRSVHLRVVRDIVLAWVVTLPAGALLALVALTLIR